MNGAALARWALEAHRGAREAVVEGVRYARGPGGLWCVALRSSRGGCPLLATAWERHAPAILLGLARPAGYLCAARVDRPDDAARILARGYGVRLREGVYTVHAGASNAYGAWFLRPWVYARLYVERAGPAGAWLVAASAVRGEVYAARLRDERPANERA